MPAELLEKGSAVLEMRRPLITKKLDEHKHHVNLLTKDEIRVRALQSRIKNSVSNRKFDGSQVQIPVTIGISLQTLNYIVTIEMGGKNATVIMDTGSDLTWVQCQPCESCYNQQGPFYDPSISPTFQPILCNSTTCGYLQSATGLRGACVFSNSSCQYMVNYGDGSYTRGELGRETLGFENTILKDIVFGCGRINRGLFGGASGLLGLGRSRLSLVLQTTEVFGGVFSYCLPDTDYKSGSLVLGSDSSWYKNETPVSYTRMITNERLPTFYFLNFTGASVGGVPVQTLNGFGNGRTLIDSGTVITRLVPSVYKVIKEEFVKQFSGYPPAPAFSILDTCFDFSAYKELQVPTLKLQFEGVEVRVHVSGMFYFVKKDASQVCLALASLSSDDEMEIIGNYQQKNLRIVYDTQESKLGFAEEACSYY